MNNKLLIRFFILSLLPFGVMKAQKAIVPAGITATGSVGSSAYTVGQVDYLQKGTNVQVIEGVQHAYEIISLAVEDLSGKEKNILIYPNPVKDFLFIELNDKNLQNTSYVLFDSQGRIVKKGNLNQQKSELDFSLMPSSVYIIQLFEKNQNIKTFKIIKK